MCFSVYNSKMQSIEESRDIVNPVYSAAAGGEGSDESEAGGLYWGSTWHMQTPLENLESGTVLLVEFKELVLGAQKPIGNDVSMTIVQYCTFVIDAMTIDSTVNSIPWTVQRMDVGHGATNNKIQKLSTILSGGNSGGVMDVATINVDVIVHQKSRNVDVKSVLLN